MAIGIAVAVPVGLVVFSSRAQDASGSETHTAGTFRSAGSIPEARVGHTATLLDDGRILIAGGSTYLGGAKDLATAVLFDPVTGSVVPVGQMGTRRANHTATLLQDGRVLVVGGRINEGPKGIPVHLATAEIYDPATMKFSPTGSTNQARVFHAAVRLADGRVLVCGGLKGEAALSSAEIYDPATAKFSRTHDMHAQRLGHTATLLQNGTVLIASEAFGEIYDPAGRTFRKVGKLTTQRVFHTETMLPGGSVLLVGGKHKIRNEPLSSAELYTPSTGSFVPVGNMKNRRKEHTATLLKDGRVLIAGGADVGEKAVAEAEVFDPARRTFSSSGLLVTARSRHKAIGTPAGTVLLIGGRSVQGWLSTMETFVPSEQHQ